MNRILLLLVLGFGVASAGGCAQRVERRLTAPGSPPDTLSAYLKAHLRGGHMYLLSRWKPDTAGGIRGTGVLLDPNRDTVATGEFILPRDSVSLFETNVLRNSGTNTAITVFAGITAVVAGICVTSPKSCFGSCPTFYAPDSAGMSLQAESFSASIAPSLEATDVDMLYHARPSGRDFTLRLTNEALETHVIRAADLLALRRPPGGRVFAAQGGRFRQAKRIEPPAACAAVEGDCLPEVRAADGLERSTLADSTDLASKETIELTFDRVPDGDLGLVIASRQSLMTTFLIYQTLAYMGGDVGRWLTAIGTQAGERDRAAGLGRALGLIEVMVTDPSGWVAAGRTGETGPLAPDTKVVPLPPHRGGPLRVRLTLTRGLWRLDYVALASLGDSVQPEVIRPFVVHRDGRDDPESKEALLGAAGPLITLPGDKYEITYRLPGGHEYELFLRARGYYLEWMRREWRAEENPARAAFVILAPAAALRALAPAYKEVEPEIERLFWESRYVHAR